MSVSGILGKKIGMTQIFDDRGGLPSVAFANLLEVGFFVGIDVFIEKRGETLPQRLDLFRVVEVHALVNILDPAEDFNPN